MRASGTCLLLSCAARPRGSSPGIPGDERPGRIVPCGRCPAARPCESDAVALDSNGSAPTYADKVRWSPEVPRFRLIRFVASVLLMAPAVLIAAWLLPGVDVPNFWGALLVALAVVLLNMVVPPVLAAIRLPLTLVFGFLLILVADALMFKLASNWFPGAFHVDNFG